MQINDAGHKSRLKRLPQRVTAAALCAQQQLFLSPADEDAADGRFILAVARARKYLDASADAHYNYSAAAAGQFNGPAKSRQELGTERRVARRGPI